MSEAPGLEGGLVYKIVSAGEWADAVAAGVYLGSEVDRRDGFLHFSSAGQVAETQRRHFAGRTALLLVGVAPLDLGERLRWEPSRGGALFPHLYGELRVALARSVVPLPPVVEGPSGS